MVPGSGGPAVDHGEGWGCEGPVWGSFGSGGFFLGPGCVYWRRRVRWCVRCRGVPVFGLRLVCTVLYSEDAYSSKKKVQLPSNGGSRLRLQADLIHCHSTWEL